MGSGFTKHNGGISGFSESIEVNCNLCGSQKKSTLYHLGNFTLVKCKDCGLVYRNGRLPDEKEVERYTQDIAVGRSEESKFPEMRMKLFKSELVRIKREQPGGRLLDVGCGYGMFLNIASKEGYEVSGVEVSPFCCFEIKEKFGLNVLCGTLRDAKFPDRYFDVVTMWDVLDYVPDPLGELIEVHRVLKRNGILFVRVRNANFHVPAYPFFRRHTIFYLYSFSPSTITEMLKKSGFKEIKITNSQLTYSKNLTVFLFYIFLEFISFLSFKKLLLGPSIKVVVKKDSL